MQPNFDSTGFKVNENIAPCNSQRLQGASLIQPLIVCRLIVFNIVYYL